MFKGFLTGFIIVVLAIAFILYAYGKRTLSDLSSPQTNAYVENTTIPPSTKWMDYVPPSKKFRAKFPSAPQHALDRSTDTKTKELKEYEMYISENNGKVFMIGVISFLHSSGVEDAEATLKSTVDNMVSSNPGNKLEKIQFGAYEGLKSADFVINNNSYAITGKAFIDRNQLYVISVLSKTPTESKNEFDYFIKSFKLSGSEPSQGSPAPK